MAIRTVRLDSATERVLSEVTRKTGWSVSTALKRGLFVLRARVERQTDRRPFDVYRMLDLGPGGYAQAPSTESRQGVVAVLRNKMKR